MSGADLFQVLFNVFLHANQLMKDAVMSLFHLFVWYIGAYFLAVHPFLAVLPSC
jgi:hypothetical protein